MLNADRRRRANCPAAVSMRETFSNWIVNPLPLAEVLPEEIVAGLAVRLAN